MIYFDSCYLAKLYLLEPDSLRIRDHATAAGEVGCCITGWTELVATLHRHLREKRLTQREFDLLVSQVEQDVREGLWVSLPVTSELIQAQTARMAKLPSTVFLRAADALPLTCACGAGMKAIYSSARHPVAAAHHFGLKAITL